MMLGCVKLTITINWCNGWNWRLKNKKVALAHILGVLKTKIRQPPMLGSGESYSLEHDGWCHGGWCHGGWCQGRSSCEWNGLHSWDNEERVFRNILGSLFLPCSLQTEKAPIMKKASTLLEVPVTSPYTSWLSTMGVPLHWRFPT